MDLAKFASFMPEGNHSLQKQITGFLRQAVSRGELEPGERLPPLRELAQAWGTNYFTVNLAMKELVREGLLVRRPRLGTFVCERRHCFDAVALYFSSDISNNPHAVFYHSLEARLFEKLSRYHAQVMVFSDPRPALEQDKPLPALIDAIHSGKVRYVIGCQINRHSYTWLSRLDAPVAVLSGAAFPEAVMSDYELVLDRIFDRFAALGCRKIGILTHIPLGLRADGKPETTLAFRDAGRARGFEIPDEWVVVIPGSGRDSTEPESAPAYEAMLRLWQLPHRPEGLYLLPDGAARGAIAAVLQLGIQIPQQLKLIAQCNREIELFAPFPLDRVVNVIDRIADALLDKLQSVALGEKSACRCIQPDYEFVLPLPQPHP